MDNLLKDIYCFFNYIRSEDFIGYGIVISLIYILITWFFFFRLITVRMERLAWNRIFLPIVLIIIVIMADYFLIKIHSFVWRIILILLLLYIIFLISRRANRLAQNLRHYWHIIFLPIILIIIGIIAAYVLPTKMTFSFICGIAVLSLFSWIIYVILILFRIRGDIYNEFIRDEEGIGLSTIFAPFEQFLFFIAAIAGEEIFKYAVTGWLVFKGIHHWSRWGSSISPALGHRNQNRERNRFMIFLIGTGMSITAGGIAGSVFKYIYNFFFTNCG